MKRFGTTACLCLLAAWLLMTPVLRGQNLSKNSPDATRAVEPVVANASAQSEVPRAASKNSQPSTDGLPGLTYTQPPGPGSKNFADHGSLLQAPVPEVEGGGPPGSLAFACGASGNLTWSTTSGTFEIIHQCDLTVPQDGYLFISTDGSLFNEDGEYEAQFRIDVDSTTGDGDTDRWVNVYDDLSDGTDKSVAFSVLKPVTQGMHTVYSLGKRFDGTATVTVFDPTLTAVFVPLDGACGASGNDDWFTTSDTFEIVRQCDVIAPQDGYLFISTDGSLANSDGEYEGQFRIDVDSTIGDGDIDRWVNVYDDSGDGTDKSVALSVLKPVTQGMHTVYSLGKRFDGTATVTVFDSTLTAVFVPLEGACGASGNTEWTTTSDTFGVTRQCDLTTAEDGFIFISTDGSLANRDGEYEAQFRIDVDSTIGDGDIDRWVNVYDDSGDGTDESFRLSVRKQAIAGVHTIYLLGARSDGLGTVSVFDPTLTAWTFGIFIFGDGFESGDTSAWSETFP